MKNILFILLMFGHILLISQPNECKHKEQLKAQKVAFLTSKLDLTVEEAQNFWPLYNELEKKKEEIYTAQKNIFSLLEKENISDKELSELTDKYIELEVAESKLISEYHLKFKKVLPIKKIAILYYSDRMFKRELLHKLKNCPKE
jgi:hypothetical protein